MIVHGVLVLLLLTIISEEQRACRRAKCWPPHALRISQRRPRVQKVCKRSRSRIRPQNRIRARSNPTQYRPGTRSDIRTRHRIQNRTCSRSSRGWGVTPCRIREAPKHARSGTRTGALATGDRPGSRPARRRPRTVSRRNVGGRAIGLGRVRGLAWSLWSWPVGQPVRAARGPTVDRLRHT